MKAGLQHTAEERLTFAKGVFIPRRESAWRASSPHWEFLYREIDRLSMGLDKDALRPKLDAARTLPASAVKELKVPVLFISGMEDVIFPPPAAAALTNLVPGAKLESVPQAGHSVYFQRPEIFNRLVSDFFEMHQGGIAGSPS